MPQAMPVPRLLLLNRYEPRGRVFAAETGSLSSYYSINAVKDCENLVLPLTGSTASICQCTVLPEERL